MKNLNHFQQQKEGLQKNSTFYFQIGLIICFLIALVILELRFETTIEYTQKIPEIEDTFEAYAPNIKDYKEPKPQTTLKAELKSKLFVNKIEIIDNFDPTKESLIDTPDSAPETPFDPNTIEDLPTIDIAPEIDIILVEEVPIYPGCEKEKDNEGRKKCMSKAIKTLVQRKFNGSNIATQYGLSGRQRINVQFLIDNTGKVTDIKSRAPHVKLEAEAKRVISKIPDMKPGKQRNTPVGVRYTLPIIFVAN